LAVGNRGFLAAFDRQPTKRITDRRRQRTND
jgi:hypothetical protein